VIVRSLSSGDEYAVWDVGGSFEDAVFSPGGRWAVLQRMTLLPASSELVLIDLEAGTYIGLTNLTLPGQWSNACWIGDDALIASTDAASDRMALLRYDLATGEWSDVVAFPDHDAYGWPSPAGTRMAVVRAGDGVDELLVAALDGSDAVTVPLPRAGVITFRSPIVWSPDSTRFGFTFSSPVSPPAVVVWSAEQGLVQRTVPAPGLDDLVEPESVTVPTPDGEQLPAFVFTPHNTDGSVVVVIHGGPESSAVRSWTATSSWSPTSGDHRATGGAGCRWMTSRSGWIRWLIWPRSMPGCRLSAGTRRVPRSTAVPTAGTWCWPAWPSSPRCGPPASISSGCPRWSPS
jgi:Tol biopolymer transport system component